MSPILDTHYRAPVQLLAPPNWRPAMKLDGAAMTSGSGERLQTSFGAHLRGE